VTGLCHGDAALFYDAGTDPAFLPEKGHKYIYQITLLVNIWSPLSTFEGADRFILNLAICHLLTLQRPTFFFLH
jgi:hypothetical protein